jgi:hypothetical protein
MPRIGGGGGPIVPPQTQGTSGAQQTQDTKGADFASKIAQTQAAQTQGTDSARAQQAKAAHQQQLIGKTKDIAKRLAKGTIDQKEATREFVSLVIEERLPQFKKKKKKKDDKDKDKDEENMTDEEKLESAVTEMIDKDPALAKRLQTQFKKLAAKG